MKIAILGTNGFLSTAIAKHAFEQGLTVDMYGLYKPQHPYHQFFEINLIRGKMNADCLMNADMVVYAIGAGIQSNLNESLDLIYSLNVSAPISICNMLRILDYKGVFVTFGSYFELGERPEHRLFSEEDIINTKAPAPTDYVISKRMLTQFVSSYQHDFTHWHFILPTIYGAGENPKRLIPYTINAILNQEQPFFTTGSQIRQYIPVKEIPSLLQLASIKKLKSGVYNVAGKDILSVQQVVEIIHKHFGATLIPECFGKEERSDIRMKYLALNGQKLHNAIGFSSEEVLVNQLDAYQQFLHE